jgi:hypothetical protein
MASTEEAPPAINRRSVAAAKQKKIAGNFILYQVLLFYLKMSPVRMYKYGYLTLLL